MGSRFGIIVIDPEEMIRDILDEYFSDLGYDVRLAASTDEGLNLIASDNHSVLLIDSGPSMEDAMTTVDHLRAACPGLRIVLITGYPSLGSLIEALRHGVFDVVIKPFRLGDLKGTVERACRPSAEELACNHLRDRVKLLEKLLHERGIDFPIGDGDPLSQPNDELTVPADPSRRRICLSAGEEAAAAKGGELTPAAVRETASE